MISSVPVVIPQQHDDDDDNIDGDDVETPTHQLSSDYDRFWELLYDSECDNPIIHQLCQTGIEHSTIAKNSEKHATYYWHNT